MLWHGVNGSRRHRLPPLSLTCPYSLRVPISVIDCLAGRELSEPRLSPRADSVAYVRSDTDGARIVVRSLVDPEIEIFSPWNVRAGRSLGGGCFDWMPDGRRIAAVTSDGEIRLWGLDGEDRFLVAPAIQGSVSSPMASPDGRRLAYVVERSEIHEVDLDTLEVRRVDRGDFAFVLDPVYWKSRIVWQAWSPPNMPWDESHLLTEDGVIVRGSNSQHQQPQSTIDGRLLGWLDDESGWLNLAVEGGSRVDEPFEHGGPTWGERQRSWCFDSTGTKVAFVRNERGFGRLCTMDLVTGEVHERAKAVHGQLSWRGDVLAAVRTGGRTPTQIVVYRTDVEGIHDWQRSVIDVGPAYSWSQSTALVEPELIELTEPMALHARLYRSPQPRRRLLCWIHGGPTDQWQVSFMPRIAYWIDRGYDVLVPDFRGSTGHGREYTRALNAGWGEVDADDVHAIVRHVTSMEGYRHADVAYLGSSAGGLTALCAAARHPETVSAIAVAYPVSDIAALDGVTHRFEAHYNRSLVGSSEETERLSRERSPLALADELARLPILIFHGTDDHVVPIEQSRRLASALRSRGGSVDLIVFEGEGHGFKRLDHRIEEFARTEEFLERHLGGHGT